MFLTIEGPDCCGKSTQAKLLSDALERDGYKVFLTKEPGSTHDLVCTEIRKILLNPRYQIADRSALFLFLADRSQHMEIIKKKLADGYVVISDRSSLSTYVYHAAAQNDWTFDIAKKVGLLSIEEVTPLLEMVDEDICKAIDYAQQMSPDLCIVCAADLNWSMKQLKHRQSLDRIESFDFNFHLRTHSFFQRHAVPVIQKRLRMSPFNIFYPSSASLHSITYIHRQIYEQVKAHDFFVMKCE